MLCCACRELYLCSSAGSARQIWPGIFQCPKKSCNGCICVVIVLLDFWRSGASMQVPWQPLLMSMRDFCPSVGGAVRTSSMLRDWK